MALSVRIFQSCRRVIKMIPEESWTITRRCISGTSSARRSFDEQQLPLSKNSVASWNSPVETCLRFRQQSFQLSHIRCSSSAKREPTVTEIRSSIQDHFDPSGVVKTKKFVVTAEELSAMLNSGPDGVKLIDVREVKEVEETGLLPRAINIPLTVLKAALQLDAETFETQYHIAKPTKDDPIPLVFYGRSAVKSSAALEIAYKLGLKKSRHYPGGWEEWSTIQPPRSAP